jgi:hypothetical protein
MREAWGHLLGLQKIGENLGHFAVGPDYQAFAGEILWIDCVATREPMRLAYRDVDALGKERPGLKPVPLITSEPM